MPARKTAKKRSAPNQILSLVAHLVRALDDRKAEQIKVLEVSGQSTITDYLVLASGLADPHLRALRIEIEKTLDGAGQPIAGIDTAEGSGWLVFDAYQIMVHVFLPEQREAYQLERLWQDANTLDVDELLELAPATGPAVGRPRR